MSPNPHLLLPMAVFSVMDIEYVPSTALPLSVEVITTEEPRSTDEKLNAAVNILIPAALERGQGILVIQHDYGKYTVRVDPEVPCGMTYESRH